MTTRGAPVPTQQNCPSCNALVYYEGYSALPSNLVPHRFHCHACGNVYLVRSTSNKPPRFRLSMRHMATGPSDLVTAEDIAGRGHDLGDEQAEDSDGEPETSDTTDRTE